MAPEGPLAQPAHAAFGIPECPHCSRAQGVPGRALSRAAPRPPTSWPDGNFIVRCVVICTPCRTTSANARAAAGTRGIIGFPLVFKGFPDVPTLQSLSRFMFLHVQFPFQFPICSSQFPVSNFSFPWFPFPASGQVGSQPKLGKADGAGPWRQHVLDQRA